MPGWIGAGNRRREEIKEIGINAGVIKYSFVVEKISAKGRAKLGAAAAR